MSQFFPKAFLKNREDKNETSSTVKKALRIAVNVVDRMSIQRLQELFQVDDVDTLDTNTIEKELEAAAKTSKDEFRSLALQNPDRAVELSRKCGKPLYLISLATEDDPLQPIFDIIKNLAKNSKQEDELYFALDAISLYVTFNKIPFQQVEFFVGACVPYLVKSDVCWAAFSRFYARYSILDPTGLYEAVEQQIDILNAKEDYGPIFKIVGHAFVFKKDQGKKFFDLESVQDSIRNVNEFSSPTTIKEGLSLLSLLCSDEELRKEIAVKFISVLTHGIKSNDIDIQELSTLVIIKTWSFTQVELEKSISIDELYNTITKKFTKTTIEGLAYLSIKPDVRRRIRNDDEVVFDLTKLLDKSQNDSQEDLYGVLVVLANLTTIEEKSEVSELKKHAQKGLESNIEEDPLEIVEFQADLLERNILASISGHEVSPNSIIQIVRLIFNLSTSKDNRPQIIAQGGLKILLKFLNLSTFPEETKIIAYRAVSNLLLTTDPKTIFELRQAQYALFLFLKTEELPLKDQLQALISLTNASSIDNGGLPEEQWDLIDHFLNHENTLIRRSAIELVCNLVQHKDGVAAVYNFAKQSSKKRYDLLVQYTLLKDVKSQCSAVAALSFGVTFPFIAEEVVKDKTLLDNLFTILNEQYKEEDLLERVLFVLYYLVFNSEENTAIMEGLATNSQFKKGIESVLRNVKRGTEPFEMALEILKIVKFR